MANKKISDFVEITAVSGLKLEVLDPSDTTDAPTGTNKSIDSIDITNDVHSGGINGTSAHVSGTDRTEWDTAYTHSQITTGNPHSLDAADVGADPAGTASGEITTHETTYTHSNLPTTDEKAAMTNAFSPAAGNPFLTKTDSVTPDLDPAVFGDFNNANWEGLNRKYTMTATDLQISNAPFPVQGGTTYYIQINCIKQEQNGTELYAHYIAVTNNGVWGNNPRVYTRGGHTWAATQTWWTQLLYDVEGDAAPTLGGTLNTNDNPISVRTTTEQKGSISGDNSRNALIISGTDGVAADNRPAYLTGSSLVVDAAAGGLYTDFTGAIDNGYMKLGGAITLPDGRTVRQVSTVDLESGNATQSDTDNTSQLVTFVVADPQAGGAWQTVTNLTITTSGTYDVGDRYEIKLRVQESANTTTSFYVDLAADGTRVGNPREYLIQASDAPTYVDIQGTILSQIADTTTITVQVGVHSTAAGRATSIRGDLTLSSIILTRGSVGGGVTSFNGRAGVVVPEAGDYTAVQVGADPTGSASAVQGNLDAHEADAAIHRSLTTDEHAAITGAATPSAGNVFATMADVGSGGLDPGGNETITGNWTFEAPITLSDGGTLTATIGIDAANTALRIELPSGSGVTQILVNKIGGDANLNIDGTITYEDNSIPGDT